MFTPLRDKEGSLTLRSVLGPTVPWRPAMPIRGLADKLLTSQAATDFRAFESPYGIHGLCLNDPDELVLVAVVSHEPGRGNFRRFIEAAKVEFASVRVIEVWNDHLARWLRSNGFIVSAWRAPDGAFMGSYLWRRA